MRFRVLLAASAFLFVASSAHAQLMPPPTVQVAPAGINNANIISCLPAFTGFAGRGTTCSFTIVTPNVVDLQCIQFVNVKNIAVVPTSSGVACTPAAPNTTLTLTFNNPGLGDGSIIGAFSGVRMGGGVTQASAPVQIPDASNPRFFQLAICPLRALTVPFDDPLCPVTINGALPKDFAPGEFPNQ